MPVKCAFGCKTNVHPMHVFPNPEKDPERFSMWMEVLGEDTPPSMTDEQVYRKLRVCDRHFLYEHRARFKRLTAMAVPYRHETDEEPVNVVVDDSKPYTDDNADGVAIEVYTLSDGSVSDEMDAAAVVDNDPRDSDDELLWPASVDLEDPEMKYLLEDDYPPLSDPEMAEDTATPKTVEYYQRQLSLAKRRIEVQSDKLNKLRRKVTTRGLTRNQALDIITKDLSQQAKLFVRMQTKRQTDTFTAEEKSLAFTIYKKSPKCYEHLTDYFVLPSYEMMQRIDLG